MKPSDYSPHPFEPTDDELPPQSGIHFNMDRRKFFKVTGGGLAVAFVLYDMLSYAGENTLAEDASVI